MRFTQSLRKNRQFQEVYKKGVSRANRYLVMYVLENHQDENLLGISVSKKCRQQRGSASREKARKGKLSIT